MKQQDNNAQPGNKLSDVEKKIRESHKNMANTQPANNTGEDYQLLLKERNQIRNVSHDRKKEIETLKEENKALKESNRELLEALEGILASWNNQMNGEIEQFKTFQDDNVGKNEYWSPAGAIVESSAINAGRLAIQKHAKVN